MCPFLVKYFDMPVWHLTDETALDLLMAAELECKVICFVDCWAGPESFLLCVCRSSTGEFVKKEYLLNKNIVHLVDNIFLNVPFKNPTHADRVNMCIMLIISIMLIMYNYIYYVDYANYVTYTHYVDYAYYGNYAYYAYYFVNLGSHGIGS